MHFAEAHWLWFEATFSKKGTECLPAAAATKQFLGDLLNTRRCAPQPISWHNFYEVISRGYDKASGPPLPRILSSHFASTPYQKQETLAAQLEWAERHGRAGSALFYLRSLSEDEWQLLPQTSASFPSLETEEDFPASGTGRLLQQYRRLQASKSQPPSSPSDNPEKR